VAVDVDGMREGGMDRDRGKRARVIEREIYMEGSRSRERSARSSTRRRRSFVPKQLEHGRW
jgi:hypothetical protein